MQSLGFTSVKKISSKERMAEKEIELRREINRARNPRIAEIVDEVRRYFPGATVTAVRVRASGSHPKRDG